MGLLQLPTTYTEREVAEHLRVSVSFLRKERAAGNIAFIRSGKSPMYLEKHVVDYLQRNEQQCQNDSKSENTGYQPEPAAPSTMRRGMTPSAGKQGAHHSALKILKPQNKR